MDQTELTELKTFVSEKIDEGVSAQVAVMLEDTRKTLTESGEKLESAQSEIVDLKTALEEMKTRSIDTSGIEVVKAPPAQRWADYYKNLFFATHSSPQVVVPGSDQGSEKTIVLTPTLRTKSYEALNQICADVGGVRKAAMQEGTDSEGGYAVPTPQDLIGEILRLAEPVSVVLQDATIIPMSSWKLPLTTEASAVSVAWTAEEAAITESEPTLGRATPTAKKLAAYSKVSNEMLADADIAVVNYLNQIFAEAIGQELDNQAFNGDGTVFTGLLNATGVNELVMVSGQEKFSEVTGDDFSQLLSLMKTTATAGAKWYYHRTIEHFVRILKDTNGNYMFNAYKNISDDGSTGTLWGYPVKLVEAMPANADTAVSTEYISFGNLKRMFIGMRQDMQLALDPYGLFINDQTRVRVTSRWAMDVPVGGFFGKITTAAS